MELSPAMYQLIILAGTLFSTFSAGAGMGFASLLLYQLKRNDTEIPLGLDTSSWIGSIHGLAGIPGIIAPLIMQWRGRKFTFIAAGVIIISGWIVAYAAKDIATILASECLHGFGTNIINVVSFDYLSEMITPTYRNIAVQIYGIVHICGLVTPGIISSYVYWRHVSLIMAVPATVGILLSFSWIESPLWLACKGELEKFKINFTKIRGKDALSMKEMQEIIGANEARQCSSTAFKKRGLKLFWSQYTRRDFVIPVLHVFLILNVSYWSGATVILVYTVAIISKSTHNESVALTGTIFVNVAFVLGSIISAILIRFFNNKSVILFSTGGVTVCLVSASLVMYLQHAEIIENSLIVLYILIAYMIVNGSTLGYTMTSELIPVKHRGVGGAFFGIFLCILHASSLKISPYLFASIGLQGTFLIYAMNCVIISLLIWKYVPETKGKTLQELENFYNYGTYDTKLLKDESENIYVQQSQNTSSYTTFTT